MEEIFGFMVHEEPVEHYFEYSSQHGFNHLEIDLIQNHSQEKTFTEKRINNIKKAKQKHNLNISLHIPYTKNFAEKISFFRKANIRYFKKVALLAKKLDAVHITVHLGNFPRASLWADLRTIYLDRVITSLKDLVSIAENHNFKVAIENIIPLPFESGYFFLGDNINDFEFIFSKLDSKALGFCLDFGHANLNEGVLEYINRFGSKLLAVHYHDNNGEKDEHLQVGQGTIPWQNTIDYLKQIKFRGPFISECFRSQPHVTKQKLLQFF